MIRDPWNRISWDWVRALAPGLVMAVLGVWAFAGVLDQFLERDDIYLADDPVLEFLAGSREEWLTSVLTVITNIFGPVILPCLIAVACVAWYVVKRRWREPVLLVGAMAFSTGVAALVKMIIERPRPAEDLQVIPGFETSFSFPSGHTTGAATLVLVVAYLLWRRRKTWRALLVWMGASVLIVVLVGGSRLYLGYHFVTDVLAGASLGFATLGLVVAASRSMDLATARRRGAGKA